MGSYMSYFPMFIDLKKQPCLVVGGGRVALRKVKVLRDFGAVVTVVAPEILEDIKMISETVIKERDFRKSDLWGSALVVAATDDAAQNHRISEVCKEQGIPVNAVDQKEDCSFIFPAYLKRGEVVAAFSSGGQSPVTTQYMKEVMRPLMTDELGELAACLGGIRAVVQQMISTEEKRKKVFRELLEIGLETGENPDEKMIRQVIDKYKE